MFCRKLYRKSSLDPILLIVLSSFQSKSLGMALDALREHGRRDKITIMGDLLEIMQEPRRLTHILYKSNMSYVQLVKYLNDLKGMGLAEEITNPHRAFTITDNGKVFMNLIRVNGNGSSQK